MKYILFFLFYFVYFGVLYIAYKHGIITHSFLLIAMAITYGIAGFGVSYTLWCDLRKYASLSRPKLPPPPKEENSII